MPQPGTMEGITQAVASPLGEMSQFLSSIDPMQLMMLIHKLGLGGQQPPPLGQPLPQHGGMDAMGQPIINQPGGPMKQGGLMQAMIGRR